MAIVRMKSLDGCEEYENSPKFSSIKNAFTSSVEQVCMRTWSVLFAFMFSTINHEILYLSDEILK